MQKPLVQKHQILKSAEFSFRQFDYTQECTKSPKIEVLTF